ncbi:MAG: hypothetical protein AAGA77_17805 [Bacteroidota bacterium]
MQSSIGGDPEFRGRIGFSYYTSVNSGNNYGWMQSMIYSFSL